jgi:hypothetical protein
MTDTILTTAAPYMLSNTATPVETLLGGLETKVMPGYMIRIPHGDENDLSDVR